MIPPEIPIRKLSPKGKGVSETRRNPLVKSINPAKVHTTAATNSKYLFGIPGLNFLRNSFIKISQISFSEGTFLPKK